MKRFFLIAVPVFVFSLFYVYSLANNTSSCVDCHTNDPILKQLCKVPNLGGGEGEG